ncbi:hypothetical protein NXW34_24360 [Bacteroides thetaiotaomicron]|uniref:hypothetical protein n=1 Tax=Bacteroides thetaiotaomicron TaxID=818 RepID=UPI002165F3AE|nr:hypothetical protein [Bacteroides thetaiotaomicron]MCS2246358.1 hypothetical protein [Bacteroides thetaiotaomicron]
MEQLQKRRGLSGSKFQTYRSDAFLNKIAPSTIPTSQKDNGSQEYFLWTRNIVTIIFANLDD